MNSMRRVRSQMREAKKFWQRIWGEEKEHNKNAEWFMKFKEDLQESRSRLDSQ